MLAPILSVLAIFILLIFSEFLWRKKIISSELSRKLIHILVGAFVAFWPLFMSWRWIELISLAFVAVVFISLKTRIFKSIHSVDRSTWGELSFAIVILLLSLSVHTKWIFAAALLELSVADGLAAVSGTYWGRGNRYKVFRDSKSIVGTLVFLISSIVIISLTTVIWGGVSWSVIYWLPLLATLTENLAVHGTDNLFVPLVVAVCLRLV